MLGAEAQKYIEHVNVNASNINHLGIFGYKWGN